MVHSPRQHLLCKSQDEGLIIGVVDQVIELLWIRHQIKKQRRQIGEVNVFILGAADDIERTLVGGESKTVL